LGIALIGQGLERNDYLLFRKLRPHGLYFTHLKPHDGLQELLHALAKRASKYPASYGHWNIDGGQLHPHDEALTCISYGSLSPARAVLLRKMQADIQREGMGSEALRTILARLKPEDLSLREGDALLNRFCISLLTEGSVYSDFRHNVCAMGSPRNPAAGAASESISSLCTPAATETDEQTALQRSR